MTPGHDSPCIPERPERVRDKCWQRRFVAERDLFPQPWFAAVTGDRVGSADLGDFLLARPGSYILKPRFGSNVVGVVRVASDGSPGSHGGWGHWRSWTRSTRPRTIPPEPVT